MQAHGHTADIDRALSFEQDADDIAALLTYLQISKASIFGFSNGATTTLQLAIRHPRLVSKIIVASTFFNREGAQPWLWEMMTNATFESMPQAYKDAFLQINPDQHALHAMYQRDVTRMQNFEDIAIDKIQSIASPALIIVGDQDVTRVEHAVEMHHLLHQSRLLVLPSGHGDYIGEITTPQDKSLISATLHIIGKFLK